MLHVLLASHGSYASGLREAAEMIMGEQKNLSVIGLYPGESLESFAKKIGQMVRETGSAKEVLILTDLRNGTPFNASILVAIEYGSVVISGVNLPLLLEVLSIRGECEKPEVIKSAVQIGREGIVDSTVLGLKREGETV